MRQHHVRTVGIATVLNTTTVLSSPGMLIIMVVFLGILPKITIADRILLLSNDFPTSIFSHQLVAFGLIIAAVSSMIIDAISLPS